MSERIARNLRKDFYESIINKDVAFYDERRTGDLSKLKHSKLFLFVYFSQSIELRHPSDSRCHEHECINDGSKRDFHPSRHDFPFNIVMVADYGNFWSNHPNFVVCCYVWTENARNFKISIRREGCNEHSCRRKLFQC
jgi:hypothetical protein